MLYTVEMIGDEIFVFLVREYNSIGIYLRVKELSMGSSGDSGAHVN